MLRMRDVFGHAVWCGQHSILQRAENTREPCLLKTIRLGGCRWIYTAHRLPKAGFLVAAEMATSCAIHGI